MRAPPPPKKLLTRLANCCSAHRFGYDARGGKCGSHCASGPSLFAKRVRQAKVGLTHRRKTPLLLRGHSLSPSAPPQQLHLSAKSQNKLALALPRLRDRRSEQTRTGWDGLRGGLSRRMLPGPTHKSCYVLIPPQCRIPLGRGNPRHWGPRRLIANASSSLVGFRRPGVLNITASCVQSRLLHCHAHCSLIPAPLHSGSARASSQASFPPALRSAN